ncbi:glycosyltransferase family 2 protein [Paraburkholderia pallida]|uniref:Glycosyltransferase family 2 protein n=1 Tax=Paraburkholderia pallida TaxID=2547399 RepID=A0A4P7D5A2_9BURK|nr:glycosyltransferase family A protein [Paraburkholderia pallida]QBR04001.1 glycosyltransferase family 2 protein [Paraburkholderia pallida]
MFLHVRAKSFVGSPHRPVIDPLPGHPGASSRLKSVGIPKAAAKRPANPPHFAMPTVSTVVPCFNQEAFIADALDSLLAQSYNDWECIVVNDGSTDGSKAIVEAYAKKDSRIRSLTKENGGVAAARNFGFFQASGSLFVPLDGNDKIHPDYLKRAVECFEAFPNTVLVHTGTQSFGENRKVWRSPEYSYEKLLWQNLIVNTTMYRREAFQRAGGYAPEMVHGFEYWEFYVRLLGPDSHVQYIREPLYLHRINKSSRSSELVEQGKVEASQRLIYERNRERYADHNANPISIFDKRMKDFAPMHAARYKRQARYLHAGYGVLVVVLLGVIGLLVAAG